MEISRASHVGVVYGGPPVPAGPPEEGVIDVNSKLTAEDKKLLSAVTGNPHDNGAATSALGFDIYMARQKGIISGSQDVSVKFIDGLVRQYSDGDHPDYVSMLQKAREYVLQNGPFLDTNA